MIMNITKHRATASRKIGGGNFGNPELAFGQRAPSKGRLSSFLPAVAVALFVCLGVLASCSSGEGEREGEENPAPVGTVNYLPRLIAHQWEVASAYQRMGDFYFDVLMNNAYCRFSADSVFFTLGNTVTYFDYEGKVTSEGFEATDSCAYAYSAIGDKIRIGKETFTITPLDGDSTQLSLEGEEWWFTVKERK